jgi:hypothetical protein
MQEMLISLSPRLSGVAFDHRTSLLILGLTFETSDDRKKKDRNKKKGKRWRIQ